MENIIKLWKEHNITNAEFNFDCGGDSMGSTDLVFNSDTEIPKNVLSELETYFDNEVYKNVNFYECSDGHYMGEMGVVYIELDEEENVFTYSKSAQAEWSESLSSVVKIPLTDEEVEFVKNYVSNINGGDGEWTNINYSKDFIMTDKDEEIEKAIIDKVDEYINDFEPDWTGEPQDWFTFNNADDIIEGNNLVINLDNYEYVYTDSEE